jgi:hypothetical protein
VNPITTNNDGCVNAFTPLRKQLDRHDHIEHTSPSPVRSTYHNITRRRREIVKVAKQCGIRQECGGGFIGRLQQWRWIRRKTLSVERLVSAIERLLCLSTSPTRTPNHGTYHVVGNQLKMSHIDIDLVRTEHPPNLAQDGSARHLYAVSPQNGINIVRIDSVVIDDTVAHSARKLPDATEVRPISS